MTSAFWVMQFSILSLLVSVIQVPYNASIYGHERMNVYAYISIVEVLLKLGVVIIIKYCFEDKLISIWGAYDGSCSIYCFNISTLLYSLFF